MRSEEHTSELQSRLHLVCRLLLEKKNNHAHPTSTIAVCFCCYLAHQHLHSFPTRRSSDLSVPGAHVGSKVCLWGDALPIDEVAGAAGTIGYELMCALAQRVRVLEQ